MEQLILYLKDVTAGTATKLFYANGIQVAKMVGSTVYYLHQDGLGSTRLVMTSLTPPTVSFSSDYQPYGPNYGAVGSQGFMYTGQPYDSATGLYSFGARFYDPTTGRFITQDSCAGSLEDPLSLDRYAYARENPERYTDANGHTFQVMVDAGGNDPNAQTTSNCVNGVCTVTTTEQDGIYTEAIVTTTSATQTDLSGTQIIRGTATFTDTDPTGVTSSRTYSTMDLTKGNTEFTVTTQTGTVTNPRFGPVQWNWNAADCMVLFIAGAMIMGASWLSMNPSFAMTATTSELALGTYLSSNNNPDYNQALETYFIVGIALGILGALFGGAA